MKPIKIDFNMHSSLVMDLNKDKDTDKDDSLFKSVKGFMIFGRFCGLLPYSGIFSKSSSRLQFRWLSASSIISYIILINLMFSTTFEILSSFTASKKNAYEIAQSIRGALYYTWGTVIYINFIFRANSFLNIFKAWRSCSVYFKKPDIHLKRDIVLISAVILISAILENSLLYVKYAKDMILSFTDHKKSHFSLEAYYYSSHYSWAKFIPYNPILPILAFLQHKLILFGWNYMDILIALLGRALYFRYKSLKESAEEILIKVPQHQQRSKDGKEWIQMAKDHRALHELLKAFESFLSPLIFISYMANIFYICMQLVDGLAADIQNTTLIDSVYKPWSFLHLILRIFTITICCARVNTYAHQIADVIYDCPPEHYNTDISRLDKRVSGGREIGLTGLGCFTVTQPYFLSFIGVIFTFEIVLLQVIPNSDAGTEGQKCCCT